MEYNENKKKNIDPEQDRKIFYKAFTDFLIGMPNIYLDRMLESNIGKKLKGLINLPVREVMKREPEFIYLASAVIACAPIDYLESFFQTDRGSEIYSVYQNWNYISGKKDLVDFSIDNLVRQVDSAALDMGAFLNRSDKGFLKGIEKVNFFKYSDLEYGDILKVRKVFGV
jgi:hypothetical protein